MLFLKIAFGVSSFLLLYSFFPEYKAAARLLWPLVFTWGWLHWYCKTHLQISFTFGLLRFAFHAKAFSDSIRYMKIPRTISLSLPVFALSFLIVKPGLGVWLPVFLISGLSKFRLPQKQKSAPPYQWHFPTEIWKPLSPDYPLLRKTYGFKGKKRFEIAVPRKPHVIFLFLESFRAKNIGCLEGVPGASPRFDALAEQGVLFTRFHANGLQTFRAMISSLFGIPAHLKTMSLSPFCSIPLIGLPEILKTNGYQTAIIQAGYTSFDLTFPFFRKHGFETIIGREEFPHAQKTSWGITDQTLLDYSAQWLQKQHDPAFLCLFTISNHHPWESPMQFPTPQGLPEPYRRFLQTFAYTDHCLGLFIDKLKQTGILEKSIVFIMGDHGQEMGERKSQFAIHNDLYQENIHIPLLILGTKKKRIDDPASQVDLLPTVLDLLDLQEIHHSVGKSLLREESGPIFFSMPFQECKIGCIQETSKLILGEKEEFYHLPDETTKQIAHEEIKQQTRSYFQSIETLYAKSAWTPLSLEKIVFEIKAPPNATDAEWAAFLARHPATPIIDLSNTSLSDHAIQAIGTRAGELHELNLSNSTFFTDRSLEWIAKRCSNLVLLNASQCLLISNRGANAVLNQCTRLQYLNLDGNDDITDLDIRQKTSLIAAHFKDCHNIQGSTLVGMAHYCPLEYLVASLNKAEDTHLKEIASNLDHLLYLWLQDGVSITDAAFNAFLATFPHLRILIVENFPDLQTIDLSQKHRLNTVKFIQCPKLTDATLESLKGLSIQQLEIHSCPKITRNGLKNIHPDCTIVVNGLKDSQESLF